MSLSSEQARIVAAPVADILVSAAAGSGKTHTMTHRVVERIKSGGLAIERALILTFTDKAADNMRSRLAQVLHQALTEAKGEQKQRLLLQELRLQQADISTIHTFCKKVIDEHGALLAQAEEYETLQLNRTGTAQNAIRPDAAALVIKDEEQSRLLSEAVDLSLFAAYEQADNALLNERRLTHAPIWELSDMFSNAKDDKPLAESLQKVYGFLRSMPDYWTWCDKALARYHETHKNFAASELYQASFERLEKLLQRAMQGIELLIPLLSDTDPPLFKAMPKYKAETYAENEAIRQAYLLCMKQLSALYQMLLQEGRELSWNQIHEAGKRILLPDVSRAGKDPTKHAIIDFSVAYLGEAVNFLNGRCSTGKYTDAFLFDYGPTFECSSEAICEELAAEENKLLTFFDLLKEVEKRYIALKTKAQGIDFSDMEHLALRLLRLPEVKQFYRQKFAEIYIDEYQDTSSIQDQILAELSEQNLFVVGDIKQSIYRFRHANPTLFNERYNRMKEAQSPHLFELSTNYRSTPSVLRSINRIFAVLMTQGFAEIDYQDGHFLGIPEDKLLAEKAARKALVAQADDVKSAALHILSYTDSRSNKGWQKKTHGKLYDRVAAEGLVLAREIISLLRQGVKGSEIAVLSRNNKDLENVASVLQIIGLEYSFVNEERVLESRLLRTVIALLHLLENPLQDNYLATVLLHFDYFASFNVHELLQIKNASLQGQAALSFDAPFHRALVHYLSYGTDQNLQEKLQRFWDGLYRLREHCLALNISEILTLIYDDYGFLTLAAAEEDAAQKLQQLTVFAEWAETFVKAGQNSLYALNKELTLNEDRISLKTSSKQEELDGIQLLTFHKSKGLEFAHVFICNTQGRAKDEAMRHLVYSQNKGVATTVPSSATNVEHETLLSRYINRKESEANLAEYLRLIYVALSRAEMSIYLCWPISEQKTLNEILTAAAKDYMNETDTQDSLIRKAAKKSMMTLLTLGLAEHELLPWQEILEKWANVKAATQDKTFLGQTEDLYYGDFAILIRDTIGIEAALAAADSGEDLTDAVNLHDDQKGKNQPLHALYQAEIQKNAGEDAYWKVAYPHRAATMSGIKYSVTEIKDRLYQDSLAEDMAIHENRTPFTKATMITDMSRVLRPLSEAKDELNKPLNAAERGTLLHSILRYLAPKDYLGLDRASAAQLLSSQIAALSERGLYNDAETSLLLSTTAALLDYLLSDLAAEIAACDRGDEGSLVYREIPFTLAWSARELLQNPDLDAAEKVLVQGVVDLWYQLNGETIILDFKSDLLKGDDTAVLEELHKRYMTQLNIYAMAVERESGVAVNQKLIWLLPRGRAYALD